MHGRNNISFAFMESLHSWWEVPCIAYFCSLFKTAFRLFEFAIEDLELGFILDGTSSDTCLIRDLIICLLRGCYQTKNVTFINWELYLYDILQKVWVKEEKRSNPLSHQSAFCILPLRTKVEILHSLCEYRLDIIDVTDVMKVVDARKLRVQPLGRDQQGNVYWYFYGLRLYREECLIPPENLKKKWEEEWMKECEKYFQAGDTTKPIRKRKRGRPKKVLNDGIHLESDGEEKNRNKKSGEDQKRQPRWTVVCNTLEDWHKLAEKFHKSKSVWERKLYKVLSGRFLDALAALVAENEKNANMSLLEQLNQHNESIRMELQEDGSENHPANFARKQRRRQCDEISEVQHGGSKETRALKVRECQTKQQEEKCLRIADDATVAQQNKKQFDNKEDSAVMNCNHGLHQDLYKVLKCVKNHKDSWPFLEPVDESYAPGYYSVVKEPIDLSVIEEKVQQKAYSCWKEMQSDFKRMIQNCNLYNGSHSEYAFMAQTLWRNFQKQIKKTFIDRASFSPPKKRVRFLLPENMNEQTQSSKDDDPSQKNNDEPTIDRNSEQPSNDGIEEESRSVDKDCLINEENKGNTTTNCSFTKVESKAAKRKRRKKRPPGMRAIEMLAKAAEKALKDVEASNLKESSLSNGEKLSPVVGTAFPNLKVSTIQNHPPFLLAKCMATCDETIDKNINELSSKNTDTSDVVPAHNVLVSLDATHKCNGSIIKVQNDQITDNVTNADNCSTTQNCNMQQISKDLSQSIEKDFILSNTNNNQSKELNSENKRDSNRHSPLILYLSSDSKSSQNTKAKENIIHHNYALTELKATAPSCQTLETQNTQTLELSQNINTVISPTDLLAPSNKTVEIALSKSLDINESPENFPQVPILKSTSFFTESQENTEVQQTVDADILNSSPVLDITDHAVRLISEEQTDNEITANEPSLTDTILQSSIPSHLCYQPLTHFSTTNSKSLQNETNSKLPSFNQFLTNGQYSLNEHGISSTVPQQMMISQFPNHLIPYPGFSSIEGRNATSTLEQFIPSQQYMCHPSSTLPIPHTYQTLSIPNNGQNQILPPLTQSMNVVLFPTPSIEQSISIENDFLSANKVSANKETPVSVQNTYQLNKSPSIVPTHMMNTTNQNKRLMPSLLEETYSQNYLTSSCIFPNSSYPPCTSTEPGIGFTERSLGIPVTSEDSKDWNALLNNNCTPITTTLPFLNHVHSRPTILKQPPIILQKPRIISKKSTNHSSRSSNGKQSNDNADVLNQTSVPKTTGIAMSATVTLPQTISANKIGQEKTDLIIPSSFPFHHPSITQANSQYLLESLEPALTVNVSGSPPQLFPYSSEKLVTSQNRNAFYPTGLVNSVGMPSLMSGHGASLFAPSINTTRNQQNGIPPVLIPSRKEVGSITPIFTSDIKQIGNFENLKSTRPSSFQLQGMI